MTTPAPAPGFLHTTRTSYDAIAEGYASWTRDELAAKPLERGLLTAFAELVARGAEGGCFQVGDEPLRLTEALGQEISLVFHRRQPERVAELLRGAGLEVVSRVWRERETDGPFPERAPQGFVLARRPMVSG
ncbi:hypothetical protein [Streptomyces sp. NPDC059258]|uniref:hypothetical protein n=1 Tax=unclassified Streptomyces TaxID=2593676 RepID=UPI0036995B9C